jgi:GT2 family glycosyltransferase
MNPVGVNVGGIQSCSVIENGKNLGFTGANSTGIRYALDHDADYLLFLNNDTIVTPDFLSRMIAAGEADSSVGIIGCKIFYASEEQNGIHNVLSLGGYEFKNGIPINI